MSRVPHIIVGTKKIELVIPYNTRAIKMVRNITQAERKYDSKRKIWVVDRSNENLNFLKQIVKTCFSMEPQMFSKEGDVQATNDTALDVTSKYGILKVREDATQAEIKRAFYSIVKKLHPDVSEADQEFFILAKKAYDTLKDPRKRKRYDIARKIVLRQTTGGTGLNLSSRDLRTGKRFR